MCVSPHTDIFSTIFPANNIRNENWDSIITGCGIIVEVYDGFPSKSGDFVF